MFCSAWEATGQPCHANSKAEDCVREGIEFCLVNLEGFQFLSQAQYLGLREKTGPDTVKDDCFFCRSLSSCFFSD